MIRIYDDIIKDIKPTEDERKKIVDYSNRLIDIITQKAQEDDISVKCRLVGSMAKKTSLMDKADMDIFITFPLSYSEEKLKKHGMRLGRYCIETIGAKEEVRYASHPYVTGLTDSFEIDFVPCYQINDASELKSAVDRTILHTDYIQSHMTEEETEQVLLLKKFMSCVNTYGANARVNGFSGYLCELLILKYHSFDEVVRAASNFWHEKYYIDLEDYGTAKNFSEAFIVIDPTDKNRNVAAALSIQKFSEFIVACRNYIKKPSKEYFHERTIKTSKVNLKEEFSQRNTSTYILSFALPDLPSDITYPQINKTRKSLEKVSEMYDFAVISSNYYVKDDVAFIILEYATDSLSDIKIHQGPLVRYKENGESFKNKYSDAYVIENKWVAPIPRRYTNVYDMIENVLKKENQSILKLGKNVKEEINREYTLYSLDDFIAKRDIEDLSALYLHLHPGYLLER